MRSQRREIEGKARRAILTPTWRNKSHHRRDLNRTILQVKEDVLEGSAKCLIFRMIPKDEGNRWASHYVHGRRYWKGHHPHDDAIVITLLIADYTTKKVLVDNGNLTEILYYPALQQMRLGWDQLCLLNSPLVGFGGMKVQPARPLRYLWW